MGGSDLFERLARQAGFDSFQRWVEYEHTRRRVEENEYRVAATRLLWGDKEARKVQEELSRENRR